MLVLHGFKVQMVFSEMADHLYGQLMREQLEGFPQISLLEPRWLRPLKESVAVVVPMLSVNTLSKLSLLIADNVPSNLILHGLFVGKPVILARNGSNPVDPGRAELGFDKAQPTVSRALHERLEKVATYGCVLTDIHQLCATVDAELGKQHPVSNAITDNEPSVAVKTNGNGNSHGHRPILQRPTRMITAADILEAYRLGADIPYPATSMLTALARDLALKYGVAVVQDEPRI
jgi:hypothetical protein